MEQEAEPGKRFTFFDSEEIAEHAAEAAEAADKDEVGCNFFQMLEHWYTFLIQCNHCPMRSERYMNA